MSSTRCRSRKLRNRDSMGLATSVGLPLGHETKRASFPLSASGKSDIRRVRIAPRRLADATGSF